MFVATAGAYLGGQMAQVLDQVWGGLNEQTVLLRMAGDQGRLDGAIVNSIEDPVLAGVAGDGEALGGVAAVDKGRGLVG